MKGGRIKIRIILMGTALAAMLYAGKENTGHGFEILRSGSGGGVTNDKNAENGLRQKRQDSQVSWKEEAFREKKSYREQEAAVLEGEIVMAGSTSMEKLANGIAEGVMRRYPAVMVTAEFTGSSAGIEAVLAGSADIGNTSRELREEELAAGAVGHIVALDGIAVIVNAQNGIRELRVEQLRKIYGGEIRNWREAGGEDMPVVVVGREAGSGTRVTFEKFLEMADRCVYANVSDSTGAVMARVASVPGAVGYVSFDVLNDEVAALALDGVMPTEENIREGCYKLYSPLIMVTRGEMGEQSRAVQALFAYLDSEEGRALIRKLGLILPETET